MRIEDPNALRDCIREIGEQMVGCCKGCPDVLCDQVKGYVPRCLFYVDGDRSGKTGSVIVGINPGRMKDKDRAGFIEHGTDYVHSSNWVIHIYSDQRYYRSLTNLVDQLGFSGPILWTELAKCENGKSVRMLSPHTLRTCMELYLKHELDAVPNDWPIIANGSEVYRALAYAFRDRVVIGVPHATGSRGHFASLFSKKSLKAKFEISLEDLWDGKKGKAVWFESKRG